MDTIDHCACTKKINCIQNNQYMFLKLKERRFEVQHGWNKALIRPISLWEKVFESSKSTCLGITPRKFYWHRHIARHAITHKRGWNMNNGIRMPTLKGFILRWRYGRSQWKRIVIKILGEKKKESSPYSVCAHAGIYEKHKYQRQGQMEVL